MATNYTGNVTPSLSNAPASSWTDDAAKRSHVGNTYLVTGSGGTAGNVYAFEEYAAPLVKNASGLPADIVTLTDGGEDLPMVKAEVSLSPIQSLNGYDHPWAGGAGKNKLPYNLANMKSNNTAGTWSGSVYTHSDITFTVNDDGTVKVNGTASSTAQLVIYKEYVNCPFNGYILNGCPSGGGNTKYDLRVSDVDTTSNADIGSGTTINISSTGKWQCSILIRSGITVSNLVFSPMIRPASVTDGTFAPYSNLCPITGHTGATLNVTGVNLFDPSKLTSFTESGGVYSGSSNSLINAVFLEFPNGTERLTISLDYKGDSSTRAGYFKFEYTDGTNSLPISCTTDTWTSLSGTSESGKVVKRVTFARSNPVNMQLRNIMLNVGATAEPYVPYVDNQYTSSFPQTVYGGTFDFVSGKLVVNMAMVDLGTLNWSRNVASTNPRFICQFDSLKTIADATPVNALCSQYRSVMWNAIVGTTVINGVFGATSGGGHTYLGIIDYAYTDAATFKAAMNGVQIAYELNTPIEIDLDPTEVQALAGLNNVWASDGQISALTYQSNQFIPKYDWFETWNMPKITRNNGSVIVLPYPKEYTPEIHDVDAATTGRNAAGTMIRDRVATKHKFNYVFPPLSQADATELLAATKDASFTLTTASPETGAKTNYRVYAGDKSLPVYWMPNHDTASWLYSSVSVNLIEM